MLLLVLIGWFFNIAEKSIGNLLGLSLEFQVCSIKTTPPCSSGMKGLLQFFSFCFGSEPYYTNIVTKFIAY
jgi:hypothetical protein